MTDEDKLNTYMSMVTEYAKTDKMANAIMNRCGTDDKFTSFLAALYKAIDLQRKITKENEEND